MRFGGRYRFAASRLRIWAALNDTKILKKTIPGCTCIDWVSENALELVVSVDFGVFRQSFAGDLVLSDVVPAERYTLSGRGRGGLLGFAHGAAVVVLSDSGKGCVLAFTATGAASNAILRLGQALIGHAALRYRTDRPARRRFGLNRLRRRRYSREHGEEPQQIL